jgi:hypothetical protein
MRPVPCRSTDKPAPHYPASTKGMYVPLHQEWVRVHGHSGLFMIRSVDYKRQCADLVRVSSQETLTRIPFSSLFATFEDALSP